MEAPEEPRMFARDAAVENGLPIELFEALGHLEEDKLGEAVHGLIKDLGEAMAQSILNTAPSALAANRTYRAGFEGRLAQRWQKALDLYETIMITSQEAGDDFNHVYRPAAAVADDYTFEVLSRLHARACLTASEVLTLMCSGHADGAYSRWRTLHELAVVAHFVKTHGMDVAERYLLHDAIQAAKGAEQYVRYQQRLGLDPVPEQEILAHRARKAQLIVRFGHEFASDYGWAASTLHNPRPTFADIELSAGLDHHRAYYRMASISIHPNARGIRFSLGAELERMLLAGPSGGGLADPGQSALISLLSCTVCLLNLRIGIEQGAMVTALQKLTDDAKEAFIDAHHEWEHARDSQGNAKISGDQGEQ